jgi:hypothetical protein
MISHSSVLKLVGRPPNGARASPCTLLHAASISSVLEGCEIDAVPARERLRRETHNAPPSRRSSNSFAMIASQRNPWGRCPARPAASRFLESMSPTFRAATSGARRPRWAPALCLAWSRSQKTQHFLGGFSGFVRSVPADVERLPYDPGLPTLASVQDWDSCLRYTGGDGSAVTAAPGAAPSLAASGEPLLA